MYPANDAGSFYFMNLKNGEKFNSNKWKELPITDDAIDTVHKIAIEQDQPELVDHKLIFEWQPGIPIENIDANNNDGDANDNGGADNDQNDNAAGEEEHDNPDEHVAIEEELDDTNASN